MIFESCFEDALVYELRKSRLNVQNQVELAVYYEYIHIDVAFRSDVLVENQI